MIRGRAGWGAVVVVALGAAILVVAADPALGSAVDLVWVTLLFSGLGVVLRLVVRTVQEEFRSRAWARRLAQRDPAEMAALAAVEERARLAADVEAVVRTSLLRMRSLAAAAAAAWDADPRPPLAEVQEEGQRAGTDLRRLLGLLREADDTAAPVLVDASARPATPVSLGDAVLAVAALSLALVERHLYGDLGALGPPGADTAASLLLTSIAAVTLLLRRTRPGPGAAVAAVAFAVGALAGTPVTGGVWMVVVLGSLAWTASRRGGRAALAALALCVCVLLAQAWRWPDNTLISALLVGVPTAGGVLASWRDRHGRRARDEAARRAQQLAATAEEAVRRERLAVARELHDVVSHAVGVMVVQAAAAAALLPVDVSRARASLDVVQRTADEALVELDRLNQLVGAGALGGPAGLDGVADRGVTDLPDLVDRMATGGVPVDLRVGSAPPAELGPVVYRIVQEALTNVLRHAPGAPTRVTVGSGPDGVTVEVVDEGPGPVSVTSGNRGYGLIGIAERVQRSGGELCTGPGPGGHGFRVAVRWPVRRRPDAASGAVAEPVPS